MRSICLTGAAAGALWLALAAPTGVAAQGPTALANTTLTAIDALKVGSFTLPGGTTGCTVILVDGEGVVGRVAQRGGAPGTRETDLLNPLNGVDKVNAIVAVNAAGDIIDPDSGVLVAGARAENGTLLGARKLLRSGALLRQRSPRAGENTTIGLVATNARLTKAEAGRMALMADDGYARTIFPSHTMGDGDTVFTLATGRWDGQADVSIVGALAADVMWKVRHGHGGLPSLGSQPGVGRLILSGRA